MMGEDSVRSKLVEMVDMVEMVEHVETLLATKLTQGIKMQARYQDQARDGTNDMVSFSVPRSLARSLWSTRLEVMRSHHR